MGMYKQSCNWCRRANLYTSSVTYNYLLCKPLRVNRTQLSNLASLQVDPSYYYFQVNRDIHSQISHVFLPLPPEPLEETLEARCCSSIVCG